MSTGMKHISAVTIAVTIAVTEMDCPIEFYRKLGFDVVYGGEGASFTSLRSGEAYMNLATGDGTPPAWWGRVIFRVDDADAHYRELVEAGLSPEVPRDASWDERYFHLSDPDGHELSFAELIPPERHRASP
jgi:catechol 2,3-dioxygenase-like lactoylglutathione lyase family enzyme